MDPLTPVLHGSECILQGCKTVAEEDPLFCMECDTDFLMDWETTKCFKEECPEGYFEVEFESQKFCAQDCEENEYWNKDYFMCIPCDYEYDNCSSCHVKDDTIYCDSCEDTFQVTNNKIGCTPCQSDEYFFNGECIKCNSEFAFCKTCIQYPYIDWAPEQCLSCYGAPDLKLTQTPEGGFCGCDKDEFVFFNPAQLDDATCVTCSTVLNHCLACNTD